MTNTFCVKELPANITLFCPGLAHWSFFSHPEEPKAGSFAAHDFLDVTPKLTATSKDYTVSETVVYTLRLKITSFYRTPSKTLDMLLLL